MNDPRFKKLPKWAQEQYRADMEALRREAALRWPSEPKPEPVLRGLSYGHVVGEHEGWAWKAHADSLSVVAEARFVHKGIVYEDERLAGVGSKPNGDFYGTEREALVAARWDASERAARLLAKIDALLATTDA